jgi:hypothetical protein
MLLITNIASPRRRQIRCRRRRRHIDISLRRQLIFTLILFSPLPRHYYIITIIISVIITIEDYAINTLFAIFIP